MAVNRGAINFIVEKQCSQTAARAGILETPHGKLLTPVFMPVATQATVKTLTPEELRALGAGILLANTYHLFLSPGTEVIAKFGGLHRFMSWDGPILTDSGGFQVLSLGHLRKISDEGVLFRSHINGSEHLFSPELATQVQNILGADIIMAFDECPSYGAEFKKIREAMDRTHLWARRCLESHQRQDQALFGIVQGGTFADLREESARFISSLDFPGYALGGLSIGESKQETWAMVDVTVPLLTEDKPRYLMGVGSPEDLMEGIARGIDMFDCVLPTRVARNGALFSSTGRLNIRKAHFKAQDSPLVEDCDCYTCRHYSAAYLHHLFKSEELLAYRLASIHNLRFLTALLEKARKSIFNGTFADFKNEFVSGYKTTDQGVRLTQKQKWIEAQRKKKPAEPDVILTE